VSQQKTKVSNLEEFDHLKKEDLVLLAKHLKIDFKVSMRKQTIKHLVIDKLVDINILKVSKNFSKNLLCYKKSILQQYSS
jgi:hypothetical protein